MPSAVQTISEQDWKPSCSFTSGKDQGRDSYLGYGKAHTLPPPTRSPETGRAGPEQDCTGSFSGGPKLVSGFDPVRAPDFGDVHCREVKNTVRPCRMCIARRMGWPQINVYS